MAAQREWFEKDYYAVLGLPKGATEKDITRAYRKLAKQYHPDANQGNKEAEDRFKDISTAYDVLGPEISSNPVQHIRMKLPPRAVAKGEFNGLVSQIPWHQDNGVLLPEADEATILTVWAPITAATLENGCLQVIPRPHRAELVAHCPTARGVAIPDTLP